MCSFFWLHIVGDFNFTNQTLTFSTGDTAGVNQCGLIDVIDDSTVENNEIFAISFTTSDSVVEFSSDQTTVNITDNDSKSQILPHACIVHYITLSCFSVVIMEWQRQAYIISEESVSVNVCAVLSQPTERNVNVMITTASGTATGKYEMLFCLVNCSDSYIFMM